MSQIPLQQQAGTATIFRVIVVCEAVVFLFAATLHTGAFSAPRLIPAMIVEGLCGICLSVSVYALLARRSWEQAAATTAHIVASIGLLLGITALIPSPDLATPVNITLHGVMIVLVIAGLTLLALPGTRAAFKSDRPA